MIPVPTERQLLWQDMELGVIIHWLNNIYNPDFKEYKTKKVREAIPPSIMNPCNPDTDQWLRSASKLGAEYAVLVANHCTGFSLWPTKENDYSVSSLEWKNGNGDVVADFIASCRKYGIKPALYYSTGCNGYYGINDENHHDYFAPYYREYVETVERQLTELWSNYGELFEIWFDGGIIPREKGGPDAFGLLKKYQPEAITFQGPRDSRNNIRWVGNEDGTAPFDCFCACDETDNSPDGRGNITGKYYRPAESDFPNRDHSADGGGWGWRKGEEDKVIPPGELFKCYLKTVGRNTNMLLGMGISTDGDFKEEKQFEELGNIIRREFSEEIPCDTRQNGNIFIITPKAFSPMKYIVLREELSTGQHINGFVVRCNGKPIFEGKSIGHKRIIRTDERLSGTIELEVTEAVGKYAMRDIRIYR